MDLEIAQNRGHVFACVRRATIVRKAKPGLNFQHMTSPDRD